MFCRKKLGFCDATKTSFKTPTCSCAIEALCCRSWEGCHWTFTEKENCEIVLLTDDTVEYLPVRRIENPVGLAGGEDERSCEPIMVEHLGADFQQIRKRLSDLPLWTDKGQVETHRRGRL